MTTSNMFSDKIFLQQKRINKNAQSKKGSYLYGVTDEKYVTVISKKPVPFSPYKYHYIPTELKEKLTFRKDEPSIRFKASPDALMVLAGKIVDSIPLPRPSTWSNLQVIKWIKDIGFPQYRNTFRVNLINGQTLLLLESSQLVSINITNYEHIQRITSAIRRLMQYEYASFSRSISLPPKPPDTLNKDFRIRTCLSHEYSNYFREIDKYENFRSTDLYRYMQIIRPMPRYEQHWELLEQKLAHTIKHPELIGETKRTNLYQNHYKLMKKEAGFNRYLCNCVPPCTCKWTNKEKMEPKILSALKRPPSTKVRKCDKKCGCMPPCTCQWTAENLNTRKSLTLLIINNPKKYNIDVAHSMEQLKSRYRFPRVSRRSSANFRRSSTMW